MNTLSMKLRALAREERRAWAWAAVILLGGVVHVQWQDLRESRWWRDVTHQTPFSDVVITSVSATSLELTLSGTLIKQRDCLTLGPAVAQVLQDGVAWPAEFRPIDQPGTPASRPPGPLPQAWGPWLITSPIPWPDAARAYRTHVCDGEIQTNEIFNVPWPGEAE